MIRANRAEDSEFVSRGDNCPGRLRVNAKSWLYRLFLFIFLTYEIKKLCLPTQRAVWWNSDSSQVVFIDLGEDKWWLKFLGGRFLRSKVWVYLNIGLQSLSRFELSVLGSNVFRCYIWSVEIRFPSVVERCLLDCAEIMSLLYL